MMNLTLDEGGSGSNVPTTSLARAMDHHAHISAGVPEGLPGMVEVKKPSSKPSSKAGAATVGPKWPVVEFIIRQGSHTAKRRMLVQPETWKTELPNGELQVSRTQVRGGACLPCARG